MLMGSDFKPIRRIGYTETTSTNVGITDIKMLLGTNLPLTKVIDGKTYHRFGHTLHKQAVQHSLYSCWVEDSPPGAAPVKDIFVSIDGDLTGMEGTGWEIVKYTSGGNADMNKDSGGKTVHLWMRK